MADNDWQSQAIPVLAPTEGDDSGSPLGQYRDTFTQAEERYGLPKNLLTAISMQENVAPRHNNPLGLSTDAGVKTFATPEEANSAIMRQAELMTNPNGPYSRFARTRNIDDLAAVYSPPGARNDIYGTNATEASGIRANLAKLGSDWRSEAVPVQPEEQDWRDQAIRVEQPKVSDWQGQAKLQAAHPVAQQKGWDLVSWVTGLIDTAKRDYASQKLGDLTGRQAEQSKFGTLGSDPYEERIKEVQIDPNLNAQQRDETIASIRVEQAREQQKKVAAIPQAHKDLQEAQAKVDKEHPDWKQQTIASLLTLGPNMMAGPAAPFTMAQQAIAQTYGDQLDGAVKKYKETHPGASDKEAYTEAVNAVSDAARASGGAALALGLVGDIPGFGGIFTRIASKIGYGAATMEVANTLAEFERNRAFKEYVDPKQDLLEGLNKLEFYAKNAAVGGVFGGLHGVGSEIGRPSYVPIEDRVPIAEVPDTTEPEPKQPEKITAAAVRQGDIVGEGPTHFQAIEDLNAKGGKLTDEEVDKYYSEGKPTGADYGFVTSTGRFVSREEAQKIGGITDAFQAGGEGIQEPETIRAAAIHHVPTGKVTEGFTHYDAAITAERSKDPNNYEVGFTTSRGRFVDRDEAHKIAKAANQIRKTEDERLAAEDLGKGRFRPVTGTEPWLSAIANRYVEPRVEAGEIREVTPGTGTSPQAQLARGLQMGPEEIAQHVSDVMQGKGTGHGPALRAREAQLSQEARNASIAARQNPDDPQAQAREQETFDALTQFHNGPMKKFKENASEEFRSLQGRIPIDLSTFNGQREKWLRDIGKEPSETVQTKMRKMAQEVRQKVTAEDIAMQKLGTEIERIRRTTNLPKEDDIRLRIMERMKDDPCRS